MAERTFADEISVMIKDEINQIPTPKLGTVMQVYSDNHADVEVDNQVLKYVETLGTPVLNTTGVLIFLNGNLDNYIFLTPSNGDVGDIEADMLR